MRRITEDPRVQRVGTLCRRYPRAAVTVALGALVSLAFFPWVFCGQIAPWDFLGVSATAPVFVAQSIAATAPP